MLNDELDRIWQEHSKNEEVKFDRVELLADLNNQLNRFDRTIKNRNRRESIAAVIIIILFGAGAFYFTELLSRLGMILGVLYGVLVIVVFKRVKRSKPLIEGLPTADYLKQYKLYLVNEQNLLKNIIVWYLAPPYIACLLFFIGEGISSIHLALNLFGILILYAFVYFMNQKGVKKHFNPLIKSVDQTINELNM
jgi:hypothetical protein